MVVGRGMIIRQSSLKMKYLYYPIILVDILKLIQVRVRAESKNMGGIKSNEMTIRDIIPWIQKFLIS